MRAEIDPRLDALTEKIIGAAFIIGNELGHGFLEAVYKNAFVEELAARKLRVEVERPYAIHYRNKLIGRYNADLVVEGLVIVELKAIDIVTRAHHSQVLNYLKVSKLPVGLLINFGKPSVEVKRVLLTSPAPASVQP